MANVSHEIDRSERADQLLTVVSGWAALVLGLLGLHRWVAVGTMDWWARAGLILSAGLAIMWVWGFWPQISTRVRHWARGGGVNSTAIAVGLVLCLILVNVIARSRLPIKADLTKNQRYTLAPRSREVVKALDKPLTATVFLPAGASGATTRATDLFRQYADASSKFTWKRVDPLVEQTAYLRFQPAPKLSSTDFSGAVLQYGDKRQDITDFTEKEVTSAILKLTRDTVRKVAFLRGHGEPDVSEGAVATDPAKSIQAVLTDLKDVNTPIESLDLYGKNAKIPDPAQVATLVIAGPEREFTEDEAKRINEFLNKGGHVLLMLNPRGPTFSKFLEPWGIKTTNDLVIDQAQGVLLVQADNNSHQSVRNARRVVFQFARSVTAASPAPGGVTVTELLKSGPTSEVVANFTPGKPVDLRAARPGPVAIAALAEKKIGAGDNAKTARLVVVGDSVFMADQLAQVPAFYNRDLASGLINYLAEEEALVNIAPKDENTEQAFLLPEQGRLLSLIHLADFPLLALLLAVVVYLKRR